jgi:hypothetical protein
MSVIGYLLNDTITSSAFVMNGKGFGLGDRTWDQVGNTWVFVYANEDLAQYDAVYIPSTYRAVKLTGNVATVAGNANNAGFIGFAQVAFTSGEYGFVMTSGVGNVRIAGSCTANIMLYTTDTAGVLDDATASSSHFQLQGVLLTTTNQGSSVSNQTAVFNGPIQVRLPRATGSGA